MFQLGRKYAEAFGLTALGPGGQPVTVTMGSYGIGITRAVAALAEQTLDEKGLCWPQSVAPADVHLLATGRDDSPFEAGGGARGAISTRAGFACFTTIGGASQPGVKFADAELLGVPTIVVLGRGLTRGLIELRDRRSGRRRNVPIASAAAASRRTLTA